MNPAVERCRESITRHSKSFALASRLLPDSLQSDAVVLYAYCRRVDDAIDLAPKAEQPAALSRLHAELNEVYQGATPDDPILLAFQELVRRRDIPLAYPTELVAGMEMDANGTDYADLDTLLLYCFRVAGTVGLMMCHVLGVSSPEAFRHAAHLGMAMQLTNICRDVDEDARRGRLYIPLPLLERHGDARIGPSGASQWTPLERQMVAAATSDLLDLADGYYASGDVGLRYLARPAATAVVAARLIYSDIGRVLRNRNCDPAQPRAFVSAPRKVYLAAKAAYRSRGRPAAIVPTLPQRPLGFCDVASL